MKPFEKLPLELPLLQTLRPAEKELLDADTGCEHFRRGELIHAHGSRCIGLLYVVSGRCFASMLSDEGREAVMFRLVPGEVCILSAACILRQVCFDVHLEAETDVTLLMVPTGTVEKLMAENPSFRCELYRMAAVRFSEVLENLQFILFGNVERRLAKTLLEEAKLAESNAITITHEQLARYTGSAREVISRTLRQFADRGLLQIGRGKLTLLDLPGLQKVM